MRITKVYKDERYLYIDTDEGIRKQKLTFSGSEELEQECHRLAKKGCLVNHRTIAGWSRDEWFVDIWEVDEQNNEITETEQTKNVISSDLNNNVTMSSLDELEEADISSGSKKKA